MVDKDGFQKMAIKPTSQSFEVFPSVSKVSNCSGVNFLAVPKQIKGQ